MKLELFIHFDGNCREALEFYSKVFKAPINDLMTYGDAPENPDDPVPAADKHRIMYAGIPIGGMVVMFSDAPSDSGYVCGNNIVPTINIKDKDEITWLFNELKEGGEVYFALQKTFFSEYFGMVKDKFGVIWQLLQSTGA
ncbi:MAG: VOC family protein [Treponema sp.]|nr:VOC family protein [Treponema sp.]